MTTVRVTEYTVNALPEDYDGPERRHFNIYVRPTFKPDLWCVTDQFQTIITKTGKVAHRLPRSLRANHYFPLEEALEIAKRAAENAKIANMSVDEFVEWVAASAEV